MRLPEWSMRGVRGIQQGKRVMVTSTEMHFIHSDFLFFYSFFFVAMYVRLLLRWSCCGNTKNYLHKYPRCQLCVVACKVTEAHKMAPLPLPLPLLWHVRDCTFFSQPFSECAKWAWLSNANVRLSACLCVCVCFCCGWPCI